MQQCETGNAVERGKLYLHTHGIQAYRNIGKKQCVSTVIGYKWPFLYAHSVYSCIYVTLTQIWIERVNQSKKVVYEINYSK